MGAFFNLEPVAMTGSTTRKMIIPALFGLIGTGVLIWLGVWQLQRLEWKQGILSEIEQKMVAVPVAILPQNPQQDRSKYLSMKVSGTIQTPELHVLVSRKRIGAGYRIIVPFQMADRRVLLDRGFVLVEEKNQSRPTTDVTITGNLHWPDDRNSATPQNEVSGNIWFARDLDQMAKLLGTEPLLIVARSHTGDGIDPIAVDTSGIANDHLQYAITWFSLAIVWLGMTLFLLWRIKRPID
jgi:surfeit locus 1 family protein